MDDSSSDSSDEENGKFLNPEKFNWKYINLMHELVKYVLVELANFSKGEIFIFENNFEQSARKCKENSGSIINKCESACLGN